MLRLRLIIVFARFTTSTTWSGVSSISPGLPDEGDDAKYFAWHAAQQERLGQRLAQMVLALESRDEERVVSAVVDYQQHVVEHRTMHASWSRQDNSLSRSLRFEVARMVTRFEQPRPS